MMLGNIMYNENWMIECVLEELKKKNSGWLLVGMSGFWSRFFMV